MPQDVLLNIPLGAGGLDTKTDSFQSQKPSVVQNIIFNKTGRADRRWGNSPLGNNILGSSNTITSCAAIEAFLNELLLFDGTTAYSYLKANNQWAPRGTVVSVIQSNNQIIKNTSQQLSPDFGTLNGVSLYAWEDSRGGIRYNVVDEATGTFILFDQPLYTGAPSTLIRPKVLAFPAINLIFIFFVNASGQLCYVTVNPSNPSRTNVVANIILNNLAIPGFYDATVSGTNLYLTYYTNTNQVNLANFTSSISIAWTDTITTLTQVPAGCLNVCADTSNNAWVSYVDGYSSDLANTTIYNSSGSQLLAPTQTISQSTGLLQSLAGIVNGSTLTLYAEAQGSATYNNVIYQNTLTQTGIAGSSAVFKRSVGLASKPFTYNGTTYVNVAYQSNLQPTYFTLNTAGTVIAKVNQGLGGGVIANSDYMLPECPAVSTGVFRYANLEKGTVNTEGGVILSLLGVNSTKMMLANNPNQCLSADLNSSLYTVGGILSSYDGTAFYEHSFHLYPENITTNTSSLGGNLGTGTFQYCVVFAFDDNNVHTQYSTPSVPVSVTFNSGTTNSVQLTIPTLRLTAKSNVRIEVYRTTANGVILYRVSSALLPTFNNPAVDTITFTDTLADTSITGNGEMYTQPLVTNGNPILENISPPSCSMIAPYADRIFLSGVDDPYTIWYSKQSANSRPAEFSDSLTLRVDPDGGAITALARFYDKLIIFKQHAVFYIYGIGPTDTGDQNDFGDPIRIPSAEVGCTNANSIVSTNFGLFFASTNGIYLYDGTNVTYKGAPAENFNALTITSATLIPNQWVVFTTTSGTSIVYDYFHDQWMTWTNQPAIDSDLYLGNGSLHVFAQPNGIIMQQTPTTFSDNGQPIPFNWTSNWINPSQIGGKMGGFQRLQEIYIIGNYLGSHTLNVWVGFDYQDSFKEYVAIPVDSVLNLAAYGITNPYGSDAIYGGASSYNQPLYMFRIHVHQQCTSFRIQITDQQTGTGNAGFTLSSLLVIGQVNRGGYRLNPSKYFGVT